MTQYWTGANNGMYGTQRVGSNAVERDLKGGKRKKWNLKLSFSACPCKINPSTVCRTSAPDLTNINKKYLSLSFFH
jgi:hypothetical protein